MNFEIRQITNADDPVLETVSRWIYEWWGESQDYMLEQMTAYFRRSVFEDRIPQTYVAYKDGEPVGTFQFGMSDTFVRPDLYPWVKNVYVVPEHRGNGCASEMMKLAAQKIREMDIEDFYLFTHLEGYYEQFGWKFVELFDTCEPGLGVQRMYRFEK